MHVGILGAGAIGCTVGARLAHGGARVTLVGRPRIRDALAEGITLTRWGESPVRVPAEHTTFETEPAALCACDVVLVTVKTQDTAAAVAPLVDALPAATPVASLQNGLEAASVLRDALPQHDVWPGMVPFNIVWADPHTLHQGTSGAIVLPPAGAAVVHALRAGGCPAKTHRAVEAVQRGKLLLNLNNAVNALAGLPLREQLTRRAYRRILADVIDEGRAIFRAAGLGVKGVGLMQPALAPRVLRLPDLLFFRVASAMISIDPHARSSMQDDLRRGRPTEVDALNGTMVRLGQAHGHGAPLQRRLVELVHEAERAGGSPELSATALAERLYQSL